MANLKKSAQSMQQSEFMLNLINHEVKSWKLSKKQGVLGVPITSHCVIKDSDLFRVWRGEAATMWSIVSRMGPSDPKTNMMQKGGYHTSIQSLIGSCFTPVPDKQFTYYKNMQTVMYNPSQNYCSMKVEENLRKMQEPITINNPDVQSRLCNNTNKKKKKKRRRRKKKNHSKSACQETKEPRQRQISVAESEDSVVILFDDGASDEDTETCEFSSRESIVPRKKVRFVQDDKLCEVHPMITWSFAYQAARRGPWEEFARDRDRFKCRIRRAETVLSHVFAAEHRAKIYQQRFSSNYKFSKVP